MRLPLWLTLTCAALVILWGLYRIRLGFRSEDERRKAPRGLFAMPARTHLLIGVVYVIMGAGLAAIGLGWNPLEMDSKPAPAPEKPEGELIEIAPP